MGHDSTFRIVEPPPLTVDFDISIHRVDHHRVRASRAADDDA